MKILFSLLLWACILTGAMSKGIDPTYLRCEYKVNPVTDQKSPRLSWQLQSSENNQFQAAYQILVASSAEKLTEEKADLWNTGKTAGRATYQIEYKGKPLASRNVCYWKVRSWDKNGVA